MTGKIYRSALGKVVDLGALILENEQTRAVGNMGVNARGDILDSTNKVIDSKNHQVQRQYKKQTANTSEMPVTTSTVAARRKDAKNSKSAPKSSRPSKVHKEPVVDQLPVETEPEEIEVLAEPSPVEEVTPAAPIPRGGLAAALAKSQSLKQELLKTPRQMAKEQSGVKKI